MLICSMLFGSFVFLTITHAYIFSADFKSYSFKTDLRNSRFEDDTVENKDRRRGARKLCCGASIHLGIEGQQERECFCCREIEGVANKFSGESYFDNPIIFALER